MSVLVYTESWEGKFKKSTFEAVSYGAEVAKLLGTTVTAVSIGNVSDEDLKSLGKYGAAKVLSVKNDKLNSLIPQAFASIIAEAATKENSKAVIFSFTYSGKALAGSVAVKLKAGLITGAPNFHPAQVLLQFAKNVSPEKD